MKRRTSVLLDAALLQRARRAYRASTNTEAITKALEEAVANREVEATLREMIRRGRACFVDVYR